MKYFTAGSPKVACDVCEYAPDGAYGEMHAFVSITGPLPSPADQAAAVAGALSTLLRDHPGYTPVMSRWYMSDPTNQAPLLPALPGAVSRVGQAPLNCIPAKLALWTYLQRGTGVTDLDGNTACSLGVGVRQIWTAGRSLPGLPSREAATALLAGWDGCLARQGMSLASNCVRTWFFVRDIDINYRGLVLGRNDEFARVGLTPDTHFIASTGIEGVVPSAPGQPLAMVGMDAVAVDGLPDGAVTYLHGATHLNPTHEYGVAFERGTVVDYPDRRHVIISGTASIDNRGEVVHPGDVRLQTLRMIENVEVLLAEAGASLADLAQAVVYLRDPADRQVVATEIDRVLGPCPRLLVHGAVCRPGWLVEMECMAIVDKSR